MPIQLRSFQDLFSLAAQTYVDLGGDPLRLAEGGDFYLLLRAVAAMATTLNRDAFDVEMDANLLTTFNQEMVLRHVRPFGIDLNPGTEATGGLVAIAGTGATVKTLPAGAVFTIGSRRVIATASVTLNPPTSLVPVRDLETGLDGNQPAGLTAVMANGTGFTDYRFVVGTNGLDPDGNPYGDITDGTDSESTDELKIRFFRLFNNPGYALTNVLQATALNVSGVTAASVLPHYPAPGYVTIYIDSLAEVSQDLLEEVKAALYQKSAAGEYLLVYPMDRRTVDLEIAVTIDGSVTTLEAKSMVEQVVRDYLYNLVAGEGLYELQLEQPIAALGYTRRSVFKTISGGLTVPWQDMPGQHNVLLKPGLIRVSVSSES